MVFYFRYSSYLVNPGYNPAMPAQENAVSLSGTDHRNFARAFFVHP